MEEEGRRREKERKMERVFEVGRLSTKRETIKD